MHPTKNNDRNRSFAALLREARTTHVLAIRAQLALGGFQDMPRDGIFALAAIRAFDVSAADLVRRMGISKQAVSQLLDTLVMRGYVERSPDAIDRRRVKLKLTTRGARVNSRCRDAVDRIERRLVEEVGASYVEHARATLAALAELASEFESASPISRAK